MAVNAKDFSAAFFHISSLKNATQVTTLPRQNNQIHFGFGKIYIYISVTKAKLVSTSPLEVPREPSNVWFEFLDLESGDCHYRIPREILGWNSGLTFVLAQK